MLTYDAALDVIARQCQPLGVCEAPLGESAQRVLAEELRAPHDLPPAPNSAMDGYAVRTDDLQNASGDAPVVLRVCDTIAAGRASSCVITAGTCAAVMTGAVIPRGADAVVKIEETQRTGALVSFRARAQRGACIRPRAAEARAGDVLVAHGSVVTPAIIGVAAGCGRTSLVVHRRPRVACIITGDEIATPGSVPAPGQKHDALGPALCAALRADMCDVVRCQYAADDPQELRACIEAYLGNVDMLLMVGGASMGAFDYVQNALHEAGVKELFWEVAIKPGKPLWFGVHGATRVLNLPGNPVSALVTYYVFARFAARLLQGYTIPAAMLATCLAYLDEPVTNEEPRLEFVRGVLRQENDGLHVQPLNARCSSMLSGVANANALIMCPPTHNLAAGAPVRVLQLP